MFLMKAQKAHNERIHQTKALYLSDSPSKMHFMNNKF